MSRLRLGAPISQRNLRFKLSGYEWLRPFELTEEPHPAERTPQPPCAFRLTTLLGFAPAPAGYDPAIGGALFAGFLVGRVWTIAAKAIRSSHVELHDL